MESSSCRRRTLRTLSRESTRSLPWLDDHPVIVPCARAGMLLGSRSCRRLRRVALEGDELPAEFEPGVFPFRPDFHRGSKKRCIVESARLQRDILKTGVSPQTSFA